MVYPPLHPVFIFITSLSSLSSYCVWLPPLSIIRTRKWKVLSIAPLVFLLPQQHLTFSDTHTHTLIHTLNRCSVQSTGLEGLVSVSITFLGTDGAKVCPKLNSQSLWNPEGSRLLFRPCSCLALTPILGDQTRGGHNSLLSKFTCGLKMHLHEIWSNCL